MNKIIFGDIHGNYRGISDILDKCNYDESKDIIIFVGDYCDRFINTNGSVKTAVDKILKLKQKSKNVFTILGNHDVWFRDWMNEKTSVPKPLWYFQGGETTLKDYNINDVGLVETAEKYLTDGTIPHDHFAFFNNLQDVYIDNDIFVVHGGLTSKKDIISGVCGHATHEMLWDRDFWRTTDKQLIEAYKLVMEERIFICGHTPRGPQINYNPTRILIDCGARNSGDLCALLITDEKEFYVISEINNKKSKLT